MGRELGERLVAAVQATTGMHPGHRVLHANGICCTGTFTATGDAAPLTVAPHLRDGTYRAVVRFSNGTADPEASDAARDGRGMAAKLQLPDGSAHDLVALTLPVFFVRTPEDFISFMEARTPDPATGELDLERVMAFLGAHPEAQAAVELSMSAPLPESYARTRYHGIHAFWLVDDDGRRRRFRYRWEPADGVATLADDAAEGLAPDYLRTEIGHRLDAGPVRFALHLQLGTEADDPDDPTSLWPDDRSEIVAGHLRLDALHAADLAGRSLIFDPTTVPTGIACSDDPILHARAAAYAVSYAARAG